MGIDPLGTVYRCPPTGCPPAPDEQFKHRLQQSAESARELAWLLKPGILQSNFQSTSYQNDVLSAALGAVLRPIQGILEYPSPDMGLTNPLGMVGSARKVAATGISKLTGELDDVARVARLSDDVERVAAGSPGAVGQLQAGANATAQALRIQKRLSQVAGEVRDAFVAKPELLARYLTPGEAQAIKEEPWRMRLFFGTAVERRAAEIAARDADLSVLTHTVNNAPQDFVGPTGVGYDITGSSVSSIVSHAKREGVDVVVTYESIPSDYGQQWVDWAGKAADGK